MAATTIKEVDERYALAVENINQRLEKSEKFQADTNSRLATIDANLLWIIRIGGFVGASILAVAASLLYMSNRAGHVEDAVSTLQGEAKRLTEAVATLQIESKNQQRQTAKVLSIVENLERRSAK
jgi:hypothetical protein